ncbi:MAG: sigma 54-interacting transcriptional regulator [Tepidibacter sp.]|uniref:sigma 54-interacting transcriptional regulator n=1 Tax=Tepidibacter sp. TaxID=2529387 RepID=UPI0025E078AA|nr:sigma 54-interacting transcriptional regulator [Tepidibacter sp.]MCT4508937.1 sigma 54-interacting transcriptional regulator [Tepidibacter sp.]
MIILKKVNIVTDFEGELSYKLEKNLRFVFGNKIIIDHCYLNSMCDNHIIDGDVILFMIEDRIGRVINNIKNKDNIIVVTRTIIEEKALKILEIPINSKVLVVNDYYETTLQITSLLYKLKFKDLQFISYKEGEDYRGIDYAITAGIKERVPSYIPNIIDIGVRCLDTSTFLLIINKLGINDKEVQYRLLKYINKIVNVDQGIKNQYKELYKKNERLKSILENSNDGIILINNNGEILLCNDKCKEMIDKELNENSNIKNIFNCDFLKLFNIKDIDNEIIEINKKFLMASVKTSILYNDVWEKIIILKDITYIKKLEQSISQKLKSKGLTAKYTFDKILYFSKEMDKCIEMAKRFATTDKTVLITGESGTGKELIAQSIHNSSKRKNQPFIAINCAALPESLLESELFGYEKGSFTGARKDGKAGIFEQSNNGTIFLDEIGDMPYSLQSRLLRVIQEMQVMRIGSDKVIDIDIRIIAATNKNLIKEVDRGNFREDLYYRLNVLPIKVPALRNRKEDIIPIFEKYLNGEKISKDSIKKALINHTWKGNVRELKKLLAYER